MITPDDVLRFWFDGDHTRFRDAWFEKDAAFDEACGAFRETLQAARSGGLDHWSQDADGTLALIILLDQLSRNVHRGTPGAFAADVQARTLARNAVARGIDQKLHPVQRLFLYLPFEHSEDLADQHEAVRLLEEMRIALGDATIEYAYRHRDLIRRFGRFPHRNAILGRDSTAAEILYLRQPGVSF